MSEAGTATRPGAPLPVGDHSVRGWWGALTAFAAVRIAIPLIALASSGHDLRVIPRYDYEPLSGDATGFYAAAREWQAALGRVSRPLAALVALAFVATLARVWRRRRRLTVVDVLLPLAVLSLGLTLAIHEMEESGAAVVGWSLVWGAALLPVRALGVTPDPDVAFVAGLALSLAALAATTVATAYLGLGVTRRRSVGLGAAGLFAVWPLLTGLIDGTQAWSNSQWAIDVGLHLYDEPLSTALVATSVALLVWRRDEPLVLAAAGALVGYSAVVKLSNGLIAVALLLVILFAVGLRRALPFALAGALWLPPLVAYWPKGYVGMFDGSVAASHHPFAFRYVQANWTHSTVFTPTMLLLLAPLFALGCVVVRDRYALAFLLVPIVVTVVVYSPYDVTRMHPRFFYVALPFVFVLEAAGAVALVSRARESVRTRGDRSRSVRSG